MNALQRQLDQDEADAALEREIDSAFLHLQAGRTPEARRKARERMEHLIAQRSPMQIARMERAKGLR